MPINSFWWPLDLSPRVEAAFEDFRARLRGSPVALDVPAVAEVSGQLSRLMARHVGDIMERDGLPHHCHVVNGWGDARFQGRPLMDRMAAFIHRDPEGRPFVLQVDPEGDFHPWQSLAYAVMAGVDPDRPIPPTGATLRDLARNSRYLNTREGRELGHLLFALAHLDPAAAGRPFLLEGESCDVPRLMEMAVEAHHYGGFEVCRKFHLTEGLCAMAARVEGLEGYRGDAQGFLTGQLDMLLILGLILREARALIAAGEPAREDSLLQELRGSLVMGNYLENHCYYAGHLVELATFADIFGFDLAPEHRSAMAFVLNELNALLPRYLPHLAFADCFLHLGHYRRAMTLMVELERARAEGRTATRAELARYTVDFDALPAGIDLAGTPRPDDAGVFALAVSSSHPRPEFLRILEAYAPLAPAGFEARGKFDHFRRMGPPTWPRSFHYELLDYYGEVGAEIHLESEAVRPLAGRVRALRDRVASRFPGRPVGWDPAWSRERGRLSVLFDKSCAPDEVAAGLRTLIDETFPELDEAASRVLTDPGASAD